MQTILGTLTQIRIGKSRPFVRDSFSAIDKQLMHGSVFIHKLGLEGDEQGDSRVHGGLEKAIHHYPAEHYAYWCQQLPQSGKTAQPGGFGENFSSVGMLESDVCLGDVIQIGAVILEISQSRQPCWKLNERFGYADMALALQETGFTGWYYRVRQEGVVKVGDQFIRLQQPYPDWALDRISTLMFATSVDHAQSEKFLQLPLTASWRRTIEQRLATGIIEDWHKRLNGQ